MITTREVETMKPFHKPMLICALTFIGCGQGSDGSKNSAPEDAVESGAVGSGFAIVVNTAAEMPACNEESKRQLVYVTESSAFQTCDGSKWTTIDIKGEKGEPGAQGPAGEAGAAGAKGDKGDPGASLTIEKMFRCGDLTNNIGVDDTRYGIDTMVTRFSNGSYMISCTTSKWSDGEIGMDTSSATGWFAANSKAVTDNGILGCVPFYATAFYDIEDNVVTYVNQADSDYGQTVACEEVYPGL